MQKAETDRTILTEKDDAWVDVSVAKNALARRQKSFLWVSERDGWNHVYKISRDGANTKLVTVWKF